MDGEDAMIKKCMDLLVMYLLSSKIKGISSMVEQPFYTRWVKCSNHLFLITDLLVRPYKGMGRGNVCGGRSCILRWRCNRPKENLV